MILIKSRLQISFVTLSNLCPCENDTMRETRNFAVKLYREIVTYPDQDDQGVLRCAVCCAVIGVLCVDC